MFRACVLLLAVGALAPLPLRAQSKPPAQPVKPARPAAPRPAQKRPLPPAPAATPAPEPPKPPPPDLQLTTTHATNATRTTSTVQMKGARTRISVGENLASIQECDAGQTVQLNTETRTYLAVPFQTAAAPTPAADSKRKGGEVTYSTTVTDTGETQPLFGFTARHLKLAVVKDFTVTACDKKPQRVETDGWYIDLPSTVSCATVPPIEKTLQVDPQHPDCVDEVRYQSAQTPVGYPLKYTSISTSGDEAPVTTTMEVEKMERTVVASSAVEVPEDYVAVRSVAQLTADHRPGEAGVKKAGVVRVGLAPLGNKSTARVGTDELSEALLESFSETELDYVRLTGSIAGRKLEADARDKQVDLLLPAAIAEVKTPRGGVIGKVSGTSGEAFTAKVDFTLIAPGQTKPRTPVRSGAAGPTLNSAITIARKVAQFAPPLMMAKYGYMNAYGSMLSRRADRRVRCGRRPIR